VETANELIHLHQGWEAVSKGISLEEYAENHPELRQAIEMRKI